MVVVPQICRISLLQEFFRILRQRLQTFLKSKDRWSPLPGGRALTKPVMAQASPLPSKPLPVDPEKSSPNATVTEHRKASSSESSPPEKSPASGIQGATSDLLFGALLPCIPVVIVCTLLLTLILGHRVDLDPGWQILQIPTNKSNPDKSFVDRTLEFGTTGGKSAYYIRYNPAILAAIAAWTSKLLPFFTSTSMAVVAFFAGRRILNATRNDKPNKLPTPHQMSILINLLGGSSTEPLWDTITYRFQNHEKLVQPIPLAFGALSFIVTAM